MSFQVKAEKLIQRTPQDVFQALKQGRLFLNCGADSNIEVDFRVGGKYRIHFKRYQAFHVGEFLEIIQDKKVVFSWCQDFGPDQKPDSLVTIELIAEGPNTKLMLLHTGFRTQQIADDHQTGWNSGVTDFGTEIQSGSLRMVRTFQAPVEQLFEICKSPNSFFADKGSVQETVPNKKITLSWTEGQVTLLFERKDDKTTRLELIHDGLDITQDPMVHRKNWEAVTEKMTSLLT